MEHLDKKIKAFLKLGKYLRGKKIDSELNELILKTENNNAWFIYKNIISALKVWGNSLSEENILKWLSKYNLTNKKINVDNLGDHRICMSTFVLSVLTGAHTKIKNFETVFTSYPSFLKIMKTLGSTFEKQN